MNISERIATLTGQQALSALRFLEGVASNFGPGSELPKFLGDAIVYAVDGSQALLEANGINMVDTSDDGAPIYTYEPFSDATIERAMTDGELTAESVHPDEVFDQEANHG